MAYPWHAGGSPSVRGRYQTWPADPGSSIRAVFMSGRRASFRHDVRYRVGGRMLRLVNPLLRRLISAGLPTGAPNVLLTTRGRRSGKLRTVPVGMVDLDGHWFVQGSYGQTGWVANLRVDAEALVTHPGGRQVRVHAVELTPEEAGAVLRRALQRYRRSRVLRALFGPHFRPPIGVMWTLRSRVDDRLDDYIAAARHNPLFDLQPKYGAEEGEGRVG